MSHDPNETKETSRIELFSDGVFAIAITLLILDLKIPKLDEGADGRALASALLRQWPSYMAFVFSFLTILIMWINHHRLFQTLRGSDGLLMAANSLLLLFVTAVPFPTAVLAEYFTRSGAAVATAIYAGFYVLVNLAFFNLLWLTASYKRRLLLSDVPNELVYAVRWRLLVGLPAYAGATVLAFLSPVLSLVLCLALWIHWANLDRHPVCSHVATS